MPYSNLFSNCTIDLIGHAVSTYTFFSLCGAEDDNNCMFSRTLFASTSQRSKTYQNVFFEYWRLEIVLVANIHLHAEPTWISFFEGVEAEFRNVYHDGRLSEFVEYPAVSFQSQAHKPRESKK